MCYELSECFPHFKCFAFTGTSIYPVYTRGGFAHQLHNELDNVRNQKNKLGKYLYRMTRLMYLFPQTLNYHQNTVYAKKVAFLHIADRQPLSPRLP